MVTEKKIIFKRIIKRCGKALLLTILLSTAILIHVNYFPMRNTPQTPWKDYITSENFWRGTCSAFVILYIYLLVTEDADEEKEVDETHQNKDKQG